MVQIERADRVEQVESAAHLMDGPLLAGAADLFLHAAGHHLLLAYWPGSDRPVGFVTGLEMIHPDKGTEMFLYELGVDEDSRRQGIGTALVVALAELARNRKCYGMWVLTDLDNPAAVVTYRAAGGSAPTPHGMIDWTLTPGH